MSSNATRKPVFERWSVERYRNEVGLPPRGSPPSSAASRLAAPARERSRPRVRGGPVPAPAVVTPRLPSRAPGRLADGSPSEDTIHRDCASWVFENEAAYPVLVWLMHVPNGGLRSPGEAGKMKALGVRKGVADWILPFPSPSGRYKGLAIELKSRKGTVSDEQEDFLHEASENGWLTAVTRSSDAFIATVKQWLLA
ncbi:VRR-NUC domain-containing protein [uncultured Variovorax sp.]|uniref:VRR-NUC domain-containing protein n=1 Tax=uncultured Variovorax sp. TaxID=114708 RepID=UPI00260295C5|nr:VRR-NUC domain-containing protein [uncultured Variovorax sp.]